MCYTNECMNVQFDVLISGALYYLQMDSFGVGLQSKFSTVETEKKHVVMRYF